MKRIWASKALRMLGVVLLMLTAAIAVIAISEGYVAQRVPVSVFGKFVYVDAWSRGLVTAEGTWRIEGDEHASPLNKSSITCRADTRRCFEAIGKVTGYSGQNQLHVDQDQHVISKWDDDLLVYTSSAQCVDYVYSVSRQTQQVTGIRRVKEGMQTQCPAYSQPLNLVLVNGFDTFLSMQNAARPVAVNVAVLALIVLLGGWKIRKIALDPRAAGDRAT